MLGIHQDVQQRLFEEISSSGSDSSYLEAVIKETMRLYPAIPIIAREATEEVEIDSFLIPKGTVLVMSLYSMQRDEKYWGSDANLFRPERFLEELQHPKAFAPFSGDFSL